MPASPREADDAPPNGLGLLASWLLRTRTRVRCLITGLAAAVLGGVSAAGDGPQQVVLRTCVGAGLGVGYGLLFSWLRHRGRRPRPPEGVSAWRLSQLLRTDTLPTDAAERAALARALVRASAHRWRVATAVVSVVWGAIVLGSVGFFASQRSWGWCAAAVVVYGSATADIVVKARKQNRTREHLREQLHAQEAL